MSDKTSQDSADPKDSKVTEGQPADAVDTETNTDGELFESKQPKEESLDLEAKPPKSKTATIQRQKQIDATTLKVINGELDLEDLPKNLKWMRSSVEDNLNAMDKAAQIEPDVEAIVDQKIAEKEAKAKFKKMREDMQKLNLTDAQKLEVTTEFNDLVQSDIPRDKALEKALKIAGVMLGDGKTQELFNSMAVPKGGSAPTEEGGPAETVEQVMNIPDEKKRLAELERLRTGRVPHNLQ